ncbi:hypothetical protein ACGC1H_005368 [Rhizoctonia solani]
MQDEQRFSIASSNYSQSQETYDSHVDQAQTRPPLLPRRSSLRPSHGRLSIVPGSPVLPTSSPQPPIRPLRQSRGWSGRFRPLSSASKLFPTPGREHVHDHPRRQPPQPTFVLPLRKDALRSKPSISDLSDLDRYYGAMPENHKPHMHQLASTYSLDPDPAHWGMKGMQLDDIEPDDDLHNPDLEQDLKRDRGVSMRGAINVGCLAVLIIGVLLLFAGYPLIAYFASPEASALGGYNLGGINASGQVPELSSHRGLIDVDTPKSAYTRASLSDGTTYDLVFSDEFNIEGRSFYAGDDPYWEAVDLHYWSTNNLEWYDPAQVTTTGGSLRIELSAKHEHGLNYTGGMLSSWNKLCFTGGYIEANVSLPGSSKTYGLWPAVWTMGNLGRAGYGASLEGTWPYTYE